MGVIHIAKYDTIGYITGTKEIESGKKVSILEWICPYCNKKNRILVEKQTPNKVWEWYCMECMKPLRILIQKVQQKEQKGKGQEKEKQQKQQKQKEKEKREMSLVEKIEKWVGEQRKTVQSELKVNSKRDYLYVETLRLFSISINGMRYGIWLQYIFARKYDRKRDTYRDTEMVRVILGKRKGTYFGKTQLPIVSTDDLYHYYELLKMFFESKERVDKLNLVFSVIRGTRITRTTPKFGEGDLL